MNVCFCWSFLTWLCNTFKGFWKLEKNLCICWTTSRQRPVLQNCLPIKAIWDLNLIPNFSRSLGDVSCRTDTRGLSCNEHEEESSWGLKRFSLSCERSWWFPRPCPRPWTYGDLCPAEQPPPLSRGAQPSPAGASAGGRWAKSPSRFHLAPAWRADPCKRFYFIYPFIWRIRSLGSW